METYDSLRCEDVDSMLSSPDAQPTLSKQCALFDMTNLTEDVELETQSSIVMDCVFDKS